MKLKLRLQTTYVKPVPEFDGEVEKIIQEGNVPKKTFRLL